MLSKSLHRFSTLSLLWLLLAKLSSAAHAKAFERLFAPKSALLERWQQHVADGPWRRKLVTIDGEPVSLDDIEHRILRPAWYYPCIHYAVNCAAYRQHQPSFRWLTAGNLA